MARYPRRASYRIQSHVHGSFAFVCFLLRALASDASRARALFALMRPMPAPPLRVCRQAAMSEDVNNTSPFFNTTTHLRGVVIIDGVGRFNVSARRLPRQALLAPSTSLLVATSTRSLP